MKRSVVYIAIIGLASLASIGIYTATKRDVSPAPGRWTLRKPMHRKQELTDEQREKMSKLITLGYLAGSSPIPKNCGITVYDREHAFDGLNFYTSGHGPEALLIRMDGDLLHKWRYDFRSIWPERDVSKHNASPEFWRRAYLFENGDILAIFQSLGLIKIDKDSNLLWAYDGRCHHDLFVADDGSIYVLEHEPKVIPRIRDGKVVKEDFIAVLNSEGKLQRRFSLLEAFERSPYASFLDRMPKSRDIFHTNTIEVLDGKLHHSSPAFRKGNVLVSMLRLDTIAVVDMETETVVWALAGGWKWQHQPTVLENGHMLLFDNLAWIGGSEVIEFDPFTGEVFWSYRGGMIGSFGSVSCGSNQRLPNGNTLISESDSGRAFEVTPAKTIVWEFISPHQTGKNNELIATLFEMVRLPPDFPLDWLEE